MKFSLTIDMDNAAFDSRPECELMMLAKLAVRRAMMRPERGKPGDGALLDSNGNRVGAWEITT